MTSLWWRFISNSNGIRVMMEVLNVDWGFQMIWNRVVLFTLSFRYITSVYFAICAINLGFNSRSTVCEISQFEDKYPVWFRWMLLIYMIISEGYVLIDGPTLNWYYTWDKAKATKTLCIIHWIGCYLETRYLQNTWYLPPVSTWRQYNNYTTSTNANDAQLWWFLRCSLEKDSEETIGHPIKRGSLTLVLHHLNSLRPSDAYMHQETSHHWLR